MFVGEIFFSVDRGVREISDELIYLDSLDLPFHSDRIEFTIEEVSFGFCIRVFTYTYFSEVFFIDSFEPGCQIHVISDDGIVESILGSYIPDHSLSGIDSDTCHDEWDVLFCPYFIELYEAFLLFESGFAGKIFASLNTDWSIEESHDRISYILIERPFVRDEYIGHGREVLFHEDEYLLGSELLRNRCKGGDI